MSLLRKLKNLKLQYNCGFCWWWNGRRTSGSKEEKEKERVFAGTNVYEVSSEVFV